MTMRALFGNAVQRLLGNHWGTKVNGTDTGVHPAMEELAAIFASQRPIELSEPLQLNWNGDDQTPPIQIHMTGDAPSAIGIYGPNGERTLLGFGLGNEGLWANAYVPLLQMEVPYETIDARYRDGRYQGSGIDTTPKGESHHGNSTGSGTLNLGGGSSTLHTTNNEYNTTNFNQWLLQLFNNQSMLGSRHGTLVASFDDYVTVNVDGETLYVAKPYWMQQHKFDGETVGGITYTYSNDQTREADDGSDTEVQIVIPAYTAGDEIFCDTVANGTGISLAPDWVEKHTRVWAKEASC